MIERLIKNNSVIQWLYRVLFSAFFGFIGLFCRTNKRQIIFSSMSGDEYGGSPKILFEKIYELYGDSFRYIWAFKKPNNYDDSRIKTVKINSFKYFLSALKSGIWITDVNIERGLRFKKKSTFYINTWHGTGPKGFLKKRKDYNMDNVDLFCSDGEYLTNEFVTFYHVNPKSIVYSGRPREDELFIHKTKEQLSSLRRSLGFRDEDYIILYMPTFRESYKIKKEKPVTIPFDAEVICSSLTKKTRIIYHGHHFASSENGLVFSDVFLDFSHHKNVNDLYLISDLLITDYSSSMFDYLILNKPVLCYAPDLEDYSKMRPMLFDLQKEMPKGVQFSVQELTRTIEELMVDPCLCDFKTFFCKFINRPPNATDIIIESMIKKGVLPSKE